MTPWTIIGWLILGSITFSVLSLAAFIAYHAIVELKARRRVRRAHAGKWTCEAPTCQNKAAYRTPNGFFCEADRFDNNRKTTMSGWVSWSTKLDYLKEK